MSLQRILNSNEHQLPKLEDDPVVPKQKSTQRKDSQVERENGEGGEGGRRDGGHAEVDRAGGKVCRQEEGQRVVRDSTVEARAKMHMYIVDQGMDAGEHFSYFQYLRYKFGFGGEFEGAGDFFNNLILKLSEAFFDLIDLEVFFGSCSSATYTRRRSRIAKPEVDNHAEATLYTHRPQALRDDEHLQAR